MCRTTVEHLIRPLGTFPSKGKVLTSPARFLSGRFPGDGSASHYAAAVDDGKASPWRGSWHGVSRD